MLQLNLVFSLSIGAESFLKVVKIYNNDGVAW